MCMYGDDEYWHWYTEYHPKARKEHRCGECSRTIAKGERYWTQGGITDDQEFQWHKTCEHCAAASKWLEVVCDGWIFNARFADLYNHVAGDERYLRSRPLTRLVRWMRADWSDKNGDLRSLDDVETLTDEAIAAYRAEYDRAVA